MPWDWSTPFTSTWEATKTFTSDWVYEPCIKPVASFVGACLEPCIRPVVNLFTPVAERCFPIVKPTFKFLVNFFEPAVRLALLINHLFSLAIKSSAITPKAEELTKEYRAYIEISFGLVAAIVLTYSQMKIQHRRTAAEETDEPQEPITIKDMPALYKFIRKVLKMAEAMYGLSTLAEYLSSVLTFILTPSGFYIFTGIAATVGLIRVATDNYRHFLITDPVTTERESVPSTEGSTWSQLLKKHFSDYTTEASKTINMFMFLYQYLAGFSESPAIAIRFATALCSMLISGHSFYWAANRDKKPTFAKDLEHHRADQAREILATGALSAYAMSGLDLFFQGLNHDDRPKKSGDIPNWLAVMFGLGGILIGAYNASKTPVIEREYYEPPSEDSDSDHELHWDPYNDPYYPDEPSEYMRPLTPPPPGETDRYTDLSRPLMIDAGTT